MNYLPVRKGITCPPQDANCTKILESMSTWNDSKVSSYKLVDLPPIVTTEPPREVIPHAYPTADVPDHVHYTIGAVILAVGITGTLGNLLVIYAFCRLDAFQKIIECNRMENTRHGLQKTY